MISLGPFELTRQIGQGGMGQIWHGRHSRQNVDVAVKILPPGRLSQRHIELFGREARAMAMLNHRAIIKVYDYGIVTAEAESASQGKLPEKSPFLVMDFAEGGSLLDEPRPRNWPALKDTLLQILEGLAHAHAHELIHRDLKPGNVLVGKSGARRQLMLADFGIAALRMQSDFSVTLEESIGGAGTPGYMAPEQIRGRWREVGPWTDLYALGCMALELASGRLPFEAPTPQAMMLAHLTREPADVAPSIDLPPGFKGWTRRLLDKDIAGRFQCAADALWALVCLDAGWEPVAWAEEPTHDATETTPIAGSLTSLYVEQTRHFGRTTQLLTNLESPPTLAELKATSSPASSQERAPLPDTWRGEPPGSPIVLSGVGLGLFGMRQIGIVGRESERDAIWEALRAVSAKNEPRAVVLTGTTGCGKSALAEWISRRALELGAADLLHATFSQNDAARTVFARMIQRYFRCEQLSVEEQRSLIKAQLQRLLEHQNGEEADGIDVDALADLATNPQQEAKPAEKREGGFRALARSLFRCLSAQRPLVLWLEDVHWTSPAIELLTAFLQDDSLPLLCILTARDELLVERPLEAQLLKRLRKHRRSTDLHLEPLSDTDHRRLIRRLLPMDAALVDAIAKRTAGNPHFAVELLSDWIESGLLTREGETFNFRGEVSAQLPDTLHQVWAERLERIVDGFGDRGDDARRTIELAACLGPMIQVRDWAAAARISGLTVECDELIELFARKRLIKGDLQAGLGQFSHEMLRESILRIAREDQRLQNHHRACLEALQLRTLEDEPNLLQRRCHHMLGAGLYDEVLQPLLEQGRRDLKKFQHHDAMRSVVQAEAALKRLGAPPQDKRWLEVWMLLGWCYYFSSLDVAEEYALRVDKETALPEDGALVGDNSRLLANIAQARNQSEVSEKHYLKALNAYQLVGDSDGIAQVQLGLGWLYCLGAKHVQAKHHLEQACKEIDKNKQPTRYCTALAGLSNVALSQGDFDRAETCLREALELAKFDNRERTVSLRCDLADVFFYKGDFERSEKQILEGLAFYTDRDSWHAPVLETALAKTRQGQGRYDEVAPLCKSSLAGMRRHGFLFYEALTHLLMCCQAAALNLPQQWNESFEQALEVHKRSPVYKRDIPWAAQEAGRLALLQGWQKEAHQALQLALEIWEVTGDRKAIRTCRTWLVRATGPALSEPNQDLREVISSKKSQKHPK